MPPPLNRHATRPERVASSDPVPIALRAMAASSHLAALVTEVLTAGWARWGLPTQDVPTILAAATEQPDDATRAAFHIAPYLATPDADFTARYAGARAAKFDVFADLIAPLLHPGVVCDMGAGDVQLISRLATRSPGRFVATDVFGEPFEDGALSFVRQSAPDRLPLPDAAVDTVIATGMLHHMTPDVRAGLLGDVVRCLAPGGALVLLEDTYPQLDWAPRDSIDERFQNLPDDERWGFLAVTDWWGNRVMKNLPDVPLPCTFLNLAQWREVMAAAGLTLRSADYLGVVDCGGHMATPRALIVAERPG